VLHLRDVNLEELSVALESHFMDYETFFWVDPATGRIELWGEEAADEAGAEGWDLDDRGGVRIEAIESFQAYKDMEEFIAGVADSHCREQLTRSIDHGKPFRHFKDAIHQFPDVPSQWNQFHDAAMNVRAIEWLGKNELVDAEEIEAALAQLRTAT
jgi:hypothetical protein